MPSQADICIFDQVGSDALIRTVLKELEYFVLPARGEIYYLNLWTLFRIICNTKYLLPLFGIRVDKFMPNPHWKLLLINIYFISIIETLKPKVVITFIDNSPTFQWVSRRYFQAKFIGVQNGARCPIDKLREPPVGHPNHGSLDFH